MTDLLVPSTGVDQPLVEDRERLKVLHLVLTVGETNSQYNEHCLPQRDALDLSIVSYFSPKLEPPAEIRMFAGNNTVPGFFRALHRALAAGPYDIVHAHAPQTGTFLSLAFLFDRLARKARPSTVYTVHDSYYDYRLRNKFLMSPTFRLFGRVVFCSYAAEASYPALWRQVLGDRGRVVPNSADLDRVERATAGVSRPDDGTFRVLSVGRLEKVKDPLLLLGAFEDSRDPQTELTFVGAGTLEDDLGAAISARGLAGQTRLTGLVPREEVFRLAAISDVYVSTSHGEGLPVAVMEVMAAGCPVVLSDIPPHREVIRDLEGVPIVAVGDRAGFAREILRLREMTRAEREALGQRYRAYARERFALPRMHEGYRAVYAELAGARR